MMTFVCLGFRLAMLTLLQKRKFLGRVVLALAETANPRRIRGDLPIARRTFNANGSVIENVEKEKIEKTEQSGDCDKAVGQFRQHECHRNEDREDDQNVDRNLKAKIS